MQAASQLALQLWRRFGRRPVCTEVLAYGIRSDILQQDTASTAAPSTAATVTTTTAVARHRDRHCHHTWSNSWVGCREGTKADIMEQYQGDS